MKSLIQGVLRFHNGVYRRHAEFFEKLAAGQHPHTLFITCTTRGSILGWLPSRIRAACSCCETRAISCRPMGLEAAKRERLNWPFRSCTSPTSWFVAIRTAVP